MWKPVYANEKLNGCQGHESQRLLSQDDKKGFHKSENVDGFLSKSFVKSFSVNFQKQKNINDNVVADWHKLPYF